jgi:glycosyltransferase involved in cell wall biosynthesis
MQSYLGDYPNAASNREEKIIRAIDSVINQTFKDLELIVIADGCEKTFDIVSEKYADDSRIDCRLITKQTMWGGGPRNYGLKISTGEYVVYLDGDDYLNPDHLQIINENISTYDWAWFNDLVKSNNENIERHCLINVKYQHGTSNVVHKRSLDAKWTSYGYGSDDWGLVQHLLRLSKNYGQIKTPGYVVCHIPAAKIDT